MNMSVGRFGEAAVNEQAGDGNPSQITPAKIATLSRLQTTSACKSGKQENPKKILILMQELLAGGARCCWREEKQGKPGF